MTVSEKYVSGLTLKLVAHVPNLEIAKKCSIEMLEVLAERDKEWCEWLLNNYNVNVEYDKLRALYNEAKKAVNRY